MKVFPLEKTDEVAVRNIGGQLFGMIVMFCLRCDSHFGVERLYAKRRAGEEILCPYCGNTSTLPIK